ncbi:hypothetical protein Tco_0672586 [Tanacetum coccineum]
MGGLYTTKTAQENGTSVTKMSIPVTAEEKTNKKNDVKARSLLLMALPSEHQLTFSQYLDAKTMFAAIEIRFGESLDSIFNRLQKIVSRLVILGVVISQEDLNSKILSSLPPEWNTHVVVWMNKPENETMSIDDFTSSTNHVNTAMPAYEVSTASPDVNIASPQVSTASFSDNVVYAFMVENPNISNLLHQDLEQIHEDDLEAMDLKWKCRAPRSKEGQFRNQDNTRKQGNNEDTSSKAMLAIDGVGYGSKDRKKESNVVCDKKSDDSKENSDNSLGETTTILPRRTHPICFNKEQAWFPRAILIENWPRKLNTTARHVKRGRDTKIPQSSGPPIKVGDEAVQKELGDIMERAAITASSLEAEQDIGAKIPYWGMWMLKLGLRLHLNSPMIHLSQEVTHLEVERTV